MLQSQTIEPGTLSVLRKLMELSALSSFSLVGGTALALRYGHRTSVDIDLFGENKFDNEFVINLLSCEFGSDFVYRNHFIQFGIFCYIQNIKVDIVHYPYQLISPVECIDSIRIYSIADIAAMKIQAMLGRGKKKDFWDIYELLQHYPLQQLIDWHKQKFPSQMLAISIPNALVYFTDAEESEMPVSLKGQTWEQVKAGIANAVNEYLH